MKRFTNIRRVILFTIWLTTCTLIASTFPESPLSTKPAAASYSADVVTSWLTLQLKITKTTPAPPPISVRRFAYTGVALYESVVPGLSGYQSIASHLNGLPALPTTTPNLSYYWPASANAALAAITRSFYPMTSSANKATIDSLELALTALYQKTQSVDELARSAEFGKKISDAVFAWSKTDGNDNRTPFDLPAGSGLWVSTPPALAKAALPYWGKNRPIVIGSDAGTDQAPIPYSEDPASAYYAQVKEVYEISQNLTPEQKAIAFFWADDPDGQSFGGGHWLSILNQVLITKKSKLDIAARAFAQVGIACSEGAICIFKGKYKYNGLRPVTYIHTVMKHPDWKALLDTPPHPEYPSGHAINSASAAQTLTFLFGANYKFTDHSYDYRGFKPRSYKSFEDAAIEAGESRVFGGIHYRKSCDASQLQGKIIAKNLAQILKFKS